MPKKSTALSVAFSLIIALFPSAQREAHATAYSHHYLVYYRCICGIWCNGQLVGEWDLDCSGQWSGWGSMPGENCTIYEESQDLCDPGS